MSEIFKDITGVAMAIVGVAILYTLVNRQNQTAEVITSAASGFSQTLAAAMGNYSPANSGGGFMHN